MISRAYPQTAVPLPRRNAVRTLAVAGILALAFGTLVYIVDRPAEAAPFFSAVNLSPLLPQLFGPLGAHLPTFTHVLAFSLLSAACLGARRSTGLIACAAWLGIDAGFELAQLPALAQRIAPRIPAQFDALPLLDRSRDYFANGTFDPADLASIALGALTAAALIAYSTSDRSSHGPAIT